MQTLINTLKIGLIGVGGRGVTCFGNLLAEYDDVQLCLFDSNALRLQQAAHQLSEKSPNKPRCFDSIQALVSEGEIDGVVITTPDYLHADHVIACLEAGVRHVIVDKPLATTTQDCMRVIDAMHRTGGKVAIGFNLRHIPIIERIKNVIENGDIGDLMLMENREFYDGGRTYMARWNRKYAWSGGLWIHKGSHDFDVFNWWNSDGLPTRVFASAGINALRPDKLPFHPRAGVEVGPNCSRCAYYDECPDHTDMGKSPLFNSDTQNADGYVKDLCIFLSDKDVHDNGIALLEYDNNVRASHMECFVCNETDRRYTVVGDKGTLTASAHEAGTIELVPRWGASKSIDIPQLDGNQENHGGADPLLVANFIASLKGDGTPSSSVRDGIKAVAVGQAAEISWREKRSVEIADLVDLGDRTIDI